MTNIRSRVRLITFITAAILLCAGMAYQNYQTAQQYKTALEVSYLRAMEDLSTFTENISTTLVKSRYAGTPAQLNTLTAKLWKDSSSAKAVLAQIPTSRYNLENTYKFLAQVGEYAISLGKKSENGQKLSDEDRENLLTLSNYADQLEESMLIIQDEVRNGRMTIGTAETMASDMQTNAAPDLAEDLAEFEEGFTAYPTLIYDGPFSDHLLQVEPKRLADAEKISLADAREKAAQAFNVDSGMMANESEEHSNMPSYTFSFENRSAAITMQGGYLSYLTDPRQPSETILTIEEATAKAQNYLNWLKIPDMELTYYEIADNILTANFAYTEGDVLFYTDLIKISVAMDDGGILGFDARSYLTNNYQRNLPAPKISEEEAKKSVSSALTIEDARLAVIPSDGQQERYCYEFHCISDQEDELLVYINADTGAAEQMLILMIDENGTLVI
ncbi:MAG: germination protein YpeB [Candidatus Merdivicinus sp.]|jgi:spore germination protein